MHILNKLRVWSLGWLLFSLNILLSICVSELQQDDNDHTFISGNGTFQFFEAEVTEDLTMLTIYNRSLDILQYILKWENNVPEYYTLNVVPVSPCEIEFQFFDYFDGSIKEVYIPPALDHNFRLHKNCTYGLQITTDQHSLNIINYNPGRIDSLDVNSTYIHSTYILLYPVYNKTTDRIQYFMKWKDSVPKSGYEIKVSSTAHNYCDDGVYWLHVNETVTELHIPSATEQFELQENCSYDIEINANNQKAKITNHISGDIRAKTIFLNVIYNESFNNIQYIMQWKDAAPEIYSVTVVTNIKSNTSYCESYAYDSFDLDTNVTELYIPPSEEYDFELNGNCMYDIQVKSNGIEKSIVNYIPACVGPLCNCHILKPDPSKLPSIKKSGANFNISWFFEENERNNIINIGFYLFDATCDSRGNSSELQPKVLEKEYAILNLNDVLAGRYCISIGFNNTFNCSGSYHYKINITRELSEGYLWGYFLIAITVLINAFIIITYSYPTLKMYIFNKRKARLINHNQQPTVNNRSMKKEDTNLLYVEKEILDGTKDNYEFPRARLTLLREIGNGAFGEVLMAKAIINNCETKYVAVKKLRDKASSQEQEDFSSEIEILKKIGTHPNIVTLIGCCTLKQPYMMIMEFVPCGDLKKYLLQLRRKWHIHQQSSGSLPNIVSATADFSVNPASPTTEYINLNLDTPKSNVTDINFQIEEALDHKELQNFASQIANGMKHLETIPIVHRDLAARNILINQRKILKISDFGLSKTGPYFNKKIRRLPLRWMAIESIENHIYDNKSDVWSFAVVLWEIATLGAFPYEKVSDSMLLYYLQNGKRLQKPEICTDELYSLMLRCWSRDKNLRPTFVDLAHILDIKRNLVYMDFCQLNPTYIFPPTIS